MLHIKETKLLPEELASDTLEKVGSRDEKGQSKLSEIISEFHANGFAIVLIFFALPIAIPLPYPPGVTTLFGIPLILLSLQMMMGYKEVRLPKWVGDYVISNSSLTMVSKKAVPLLRKIEEYLKPRFALASSVYCEQLVGLVSVICAIAIAIPLPMTNAIPAWGIVIMSLGLLKRDGLVVIAGFVVAIIGVVIAAIATASVWFLVKTAIAALF